MLTSLDEFSRPLPIGPTKEEEAQLNMWTPILKERTNLSEIDEFPENQLISFEKETIGFYISRHPYRAIKKK